MANSHLVVVRDHGQTFKLAAIWFGSDGSYYVTAPYHSTNGKAALFKATVNYAKREQSILYSEMIEIAGLDDDNKRLKLSHHASGWIQFSGYGITSGFDEDGKAKGMAMKSWPLVAPVRGPAFAISMCGLQQFQQLSTPSRTEVCFVADQIIDVPGANGFTLEGYYFPSELRRFVHFDETGKPIITNVHPNGVTFELKVVFPPRECMLQGFLGLDLWRSDVNLGANAHGFTISTSTGNYRKNESGEALADGMFAAYPRAEDTPLRLLLNWPPLRLPMGSNVTKFVSEPQMRSTERS